MELDTVSANGWWYRTKRTLRRYINGVRAHGAFHDASNRQRLYVFVGFVGLGSLIKLLQHGTRKQKYNFLCPIVLISLLKLACSLLLYARFDGHLGDVLQRIRSELPVVMRYSVVSLLFCTYDVLSFVNLTRLDPQTYLVFLQMRTVITAGIWEVAFGKILSWRRHVGLGLMVAGCIVKQVAGGFELDTALKISVTEYSLIALQVGANCMAGVANEVLLKQKSDLTLNLQNSIQYAWTVFWCLFVGAVCPLEGIHLNPLDISEWIKMADSSMLPSILVLVALGLLTSVLLKVLDSIWKAVATSVELFLTSYASALVFGYAVSSSDILALSITAAGVGVYSLCT